MFWKKKPLLFAIVSESDSRSVPYPYVYVEKDGKVRELHAGERTYLETPFYPTDGSRPFVKSFFNQKNDVGDMRGYCLRSKIPSDTVIHEPPMKDPTVLSYDEFIENEIKMAEELGFDIFDKGNGKVVFRKKKHN